MKIYKKWKGYDDDDGGGDRGSVSGGNEGGGARGGGKEAKKKGNGSGKVGSDKFMAWDLSDVDGNAEEVKGGD